MSTTRTHTTHTGVKRLGRYLGCALAVASVGMMAPSAHADDTPAPPAPNQQRLEKACARVPEAETRVADRIARLQGDASTKGSLAWLQAQIDKATAKDRTQLVTVLQNRLDLRTQLLGLLQQRQASIAEVKQICIDHGITV
jgi:division protein CdvB (Snf7/Vps24/ESCRT-III family)